jgi:ABC-type transport system substrate-binding protein
VDREIVDCLQEFTVVTPRLSTARLHSIKHFKCDQPIPLRHSRQHVRLPDTGHAVIRRNSDSRIRQKCISGIPSTRPKIAADPYDPARAKQLLAEAGYPNGFDAGDLYPWPPYFSTGEAIIGYLGAIGIRSRLRTMERAAFYAALGTKKLKGLCMCVNAVYGNASSRLSETVPSDGAFAYGGYPDLDELYKQQAVETNAEKREAMLQQIQQTLHERRRFAPIYDYIWASGIGPRVENPALMLIDPYPWSAPLEEVRLKRQ